MEFQLWLKLHGIKIAAVVFIAWFASSVGQRVISRAVFSLTKKGDKLSDSQKQRAKTLAGVFNSAFVFTIWIIALLTVMPEVGINIAPLLAGAGIAGIAIGMGARNLIQDYLSGIVILMEDQYRVGEEIEISGIKGAVLDLNLRRTVLNSDNIMHFIPNGKIDKVANFSRKN